MDLRIWLFSQQFSNKLFNKPTEKMKKVFALMSIVAMFSMVACGPSNQEKEEAEKARVADSTRIADSILAEQKAAEAMAAQQDTTVTDTTAPAEGAEHEGH